jgi:hypothetical protein
VRKREGENYLEDIGVSFEDNTKMVLKEIERDIVNWIRLAQER